MLTEFTKTKELINKSQNILIIPQEELCGDSLGSTLALQESLQNSNAKTINLNTHLPKNIPLRLQFLLPEKKNEEYRPLSKNLIISIDDNLDKINTLHYEKEKNKLKVILSLEHDHDICEKDINIETFAFNYDLIITIDTPNLTLLGKIYETHPSLFANTPIINIDHHKNNWQFGNINLVNPRASSTAEIIIDLLGFLKIPINETSATHLLCGIIEKTQSFRKSQTAPRTFHLASNLLNRGAKQDLIIQHLYKTKPINTIKLWGEIMTHLKYDNHKKLISSFITAGMLQKANSDISIIKHLLTELKENFSNHNHFLILWESGDNIHGIFATKNVSILEKVILYIPGKIKNNSLVFKLSEKNLHRAETHVFNLIQSIL